MDTGFVATVRGNSSPYPTLEQLDRRTKSGGSPFFIKASEATTLASGGGKLWLEEIGPTVCRSPLNPDGPVFEQSSITSESINQFNNSIVGVFYGAKVSTPCKKEGLENSDPLVDVTISKLQDPEVTLNAVGQQKSASPMWEISEINSVLEEPTPSLDVSISDLRFPYGSNESEPQVPAHSSASAPFAQWVGVKHKDMGRSFLQPFCYQRQLSASEIQIGLAPPLCSYQISAVAPDKPGEWQLEVKGIQAP
ncbi:uncharacterized protein LOC122941980 [Bufo gargarizans]|uniref:uncharacterized protein LOC122941980 n=1 Tax=Bufo gargarizans TaxID=30331 RepID=UPI001CF3834C|nr:uncharacterized protein LOC122941980 [Bufo gargarizans]